MNGPYLIESAPKVPPIPRRETAAREIVEHDHGADCAAAVSGYRDELDQNETTLDARRSTSGTTMSK